MSDNEQTIPAGWPPGYRSLTYDGGWTWVLKVGTREIAGADNPADESGWYCSEEEARLAAHCHHRTTREYELEQRVRELGVMSDAVHSICQYIPTPWHVIDTRDVGGEGWEIWDGLNRTVCKVNEADLDLERMRCSVINAAAALERGDDE